VLLNAKFLGSYRNGDISNPWTPLEGLMKNTRDESILPAVPSRRLFTGPRPHIASQLSKKRRRNLPGTCGQGSNCPSVNYCVFFSWTPARRPAFWFSRTLRSPGIPDLTAQLFPSAHRLPCCCPATARLPGGTRLHSDDRGWVVRVECGGGWAFANLPACRG
jgi:hypothetical protein